MGGLIWVLMLAAEIAAAAAIAMNRMKKKANERRKEEAVRPPLTVCRGTQIVLRSRQGLEHI